MTQQFLLVLFSLLTICKINGDNPLKESFTNHKRQLHGTTNDSTTSVNIYSNFAEITRKISASELPVEFSEDEWQNIRSDTITLYGTNINITSQTLTEKKKSLNGEKIYLRRSHGGKTQIVEVIMIDEKQNLVQDMSTKRYFRLLNSDKVEYTSLPPTQKYIVSFTYNIKQNITDQGWYLTYLRSNLNWKTRYNLFLQDEEQPPQLNCLADIRNDGENTVAIKSAELLAGDINIQISNNDGSSNGSPEAGSGSSSGNTPSSPPVISIPKESAGIYAFSIDKPFTIEAKTNYILPMSQPTVKVDQFCSIKKSFYPSNNGGNAQRSYRLRSDQFLSNGDALIRAFGSLVGEAYWPDIAANDDYEFSVGVDPDVVYIENVVLLPSKVLNNTSAKPQYSGSDVTTVRQLSYDINLKLKNFKKRLVKVEYTLQFDGKQFMIQGKTSFIQVGTEIQGNFTLNGGEEKDYKFKINTIE